MIFTSLFSAHVDLFRVVGNFLPADLLNHTMACVARHSKSLIYSKDKTCFAT